MQYLLDFIQEHTLEQHLSLVAPSPSGALELKWDRRQDPEHRQLRSQLHPELERVHRSHVIEELEARGADMQAIKRELTTLLAAQIERASEVLRDPEQHLGEELVQRFVLGRQRFIRDLQAALEQLGTRGSTLSIVHGGGEETAIRTGHLSIVR